MTTSRDHIRCTEMMHKHNMICKVGVKVGNEASNLNVWFESNVQTSSIVANKVNKVWCRQNYSWSNAAKQNIARVLQIIYNATNHVGNGLHW